MSRYWNDNLYLTEDELAHHGVLGMHWGVRRYQNYDGSLKGGSKKKSKKKKAVIVSEASGHKWEQSSDRSKSYADKAALQTWKNGSTAKKIGAFAFNGTGTAAYAMQRARGQSKIKSYLKAHINLGSIGGSIVGTLGGAAIGKAINADNPAVSMVVGNVAGMTLGSYASYSRSRESYIKDRQRDKE